MQVASPVKDLLVNRLHELLLLCDHFGVNTWQSGSWRSSFALYSAQTAFAMRERSFLNLSSVEMTPRISPMTSLIPAFALYQRSSGSCAGYGNRGSRR